MPFEGDALDVHEYKLPIGGVNLNVGRLEIGETEALQLKNLYVKGGIKKRNGYVRRGDDPVETGANFITLLHRFYKQDKTSELLVASATSIYKEVSEAQSLILFGLGSTIGNADSQGDNAFDGDVTKTAAEGAILTSGTQFFLGKDWGSTLKKVVSGFTVTGSSDQGFESGANDNVTVVLEGSNDNFSTTDTLGATAAAADANSKEFENITTITIVILSLTDSNTIDLESTNAILLTGHRYHRLNITQDGSAAQMNVAEIDFHTTTTWEHLYTGLTADLPIMAETWGANDVVYFANGTDVGLKYDGSTVSTITGLSTEVPIQFLEFQDRLLVLTTDTPGSLRWSQSFDDIAPFVSDAATEVRPDSYIYGMIIHSASDTQEQGQNARVLLAGASGMYLFSGTNLSLTFSNYTIQSLATKVGCNAPQTMQWTPMGTMYLGTDGQVYLLPFNSIQPLPVGENIRSKIDGFEGIEILDADVMSKARAVYHDGFYKITFAGTGSTVNSIQFWVDILSAFRRSASQSIANRVLSIGWFGPMVGMTFSEIHNMTGPGDIDVLVAGEATTSASKGAFVYNLTTTAVDDDGTSIAYKLQTFFNPLTSKYLNDVCRMMEIEILSSPETVTIQFEDSAGGVSGDSSPIIDLTTAGSFYNEVYFGEVYYGGLAQERIRIPIDPPIEMRYVSILISGDSSQRFELYALSLEANEQNLPLATRRT